MFHSGYELGVIPRPYGRGYSGAPLWGAVNSALDGEAFIRAGRYAWFGVYPTLGEVKAVPSTELKAVQEHRAPKTSTPILHTRGVESKVVRAVHCAPGLVMQTKVLGLNLIFRALTSAATDGAAEGAQ